MSCSNPNSGVCTPITTSPSSRYACDHARTYGSWRSQLMQVSVQKFTSTTRPCSSSGPSGSELSHAAAPSSEGMCRRSDTVMVWSLLLSPPRERGERQDDHDEPDDHHPPRGVEPHEVGPAARLGPEVVPAPPGIALRVFLRLRHESGRRRRG